MEDLKRKKEELKELAIPKLVDKSDVTEDSNTVEEKKKKRKIDYQENLTDIVNINSAKGTSQLDIVKSVSVSSSEVKRQDENGQEGSSSDSTNGKTAVNNFTENNKKGCNGNEEKKKGNCDDEKSTVVSSEVKGQKENGKVSMGATTQQPVVSNTASKNTSCVPQHPQ